MQPEEPVPPELHRILASVRNDHGPVVFLTGAGISAESGIPTFRGEEGFWRVGSRHYRPQELATYQAFRAMPAAIWAWYLHRRSLYVDAAPNAAHLALAELERARGDDFLLLTQNVDGLHLRAGNSIERTYQIHGNIGFSRCAAECSPDIRPLPPNLAVWSRDQELDAETEKQLTCPRCGDWLRPHLLWFDEYYDEARYRFESSMAAAATCSLLVVVGTSGATNLPIQVAATVARRGAAFVVVDTAGSPFAEMATRNPNGWFARGTAGALVPAIAAALR